MEQDNLTAKQKDYAIFLPAISTFYATYIGKQRHDPNYIDKSRIPSGFNTGIEGMNWLNSKKGYFTYKWSLYSAGHANLDASVFDAREDMIRNREAGTFLLGDSGGFQIGKGAWEGNWKDPNCPKAQKKRQQVLKWLDTFMDRGMTLDIPSWTTRFEASRAATGLDNFQDGVAATFINNDYFIKNRSGKCKFLNVLQGETHSDADDWYALMKKYCDPKQYPNEHFNGWAMGGQNMCDPHLVLRRLVALRFDGLLEPGLHDWMHFLGTSKLEWALLLTDIQRAVRKYHNPKFTISFDCASPFLATANGQIYYDVRLDDLTKWSYQMKASVDNKKYSKDQRNFRDALLQDKIFEKFIESPISQRLKVNDICCYGPGDLNKIGKEGKTSWDSFSYALQMAHNVWTHIYAVQEGNRIYETGVMPSMLDTAFSDKNRMFFYDDHRFFKDIVNDVFATSDRGKAEKLIEHFNEYWKTIIGSRGNVGQKTQNSQSMFNRLFSQTVEKTEDCYGIDDSGLDNSKLENLEMNGD